MTIRKLIAHFEQKRRDATIVLEALYAEVPRKHTRPARKPGRRKMSAKDRRHLSRKMRRAWKERKAEARRARTES